MLTHLSQLFGSDQTVQAICLTLFYSLAVGVVTAALAGVMIIFTKRQSAHLRYNLLCSLLILFIAASFIIFFMEKNNIHMAGSVPTSTTVMAPAKNIVQSTGDTASTNLFNVNTTAAFFDRWSGWVVFIWLICCIAKSIKLTRQFLHIRKVRRQEIFEVDKSWNERMVSIKTKLGINKAVALFESRLVNVPVTIGHLKPVILLPIGMLLQLTPEQVETILLHELAHISRRDYLVNILQTVVETIFFFNPAIWWLSALIREEREACCDDLVLNNITRKQGYLEALMAFSSAQNTSHSFAMGLNRRGQLLNRLRRMVNKENQSLNVPEKLMLLGAIIILSAFTIAPKATVAVQRSIGFVRNQLAKPLLAIVPVVSKQTESAHIVSKKSVALLPIKQTDLQQEPVDTSFNFKSILFNNHNNEDLANCDMSVIDGKDIRYHIIIANGQIVGLQVDGVTIPDKEFAQFGGLVRQIDQTLASKKHDPFKGDTQKSSDRKSDFFAKQNTYINPQKHIPLPPDITADRQRVREVISVLIEAHVISKPEDVEWFGLSDTELIVNGKAQPAALQQQLKIKIGVKPEYGLYYGPIKMKGTGIVLDKSDL